MIKVPRTIVDRVAATYGAYFQITTGIAAAKLACDILDEEKVHEQITILCRSFSFSRSDLRGLRLLEVGSGMGIFLAVLRRDYGVETFGIEPASEGFDNNLVLAKDVLASYGLDPGIVVDACGENLPFPNDHFDLIYSSNVLEHTEEPCAVLLEAIRVLRPSGRLQFVFPNYGSFFEGHYVIPWIPYLNHRLGSIWVRLWGKDPAFLGTLRFTNYFRVKSWAKNQPDIKIISFGEDVFRERMLSRNIGNWAGLGKVKQWIELAHRLKLIRPVTYVLMWIKSYEPIILSLSKQSAQLKPKDPDNREIYEVNWTDWTDMKRFGPSSRWLRALIGDQLSLIPPNLTPTKIVDYGCGEGATTHFIAVKFPKATTIGVDRSRAGIECAVHGYASPNLSFECRADTSALEDGIADLVTCFEVLEHVDDWRVTTQELARLSKRYVLVSFPTGRMRKFERNVGHLRNFQPNQFERYADSIGLSKVSIYYAGFPFYSPIFRELFNLTNSGGNSLSRGHYSWWQKRLSDVIYLLFRKLSTTRNSGDQFCGLFEKRNL